MKVEHWICDNCGKVMTKSNWELDMDHDFCSLKCKEKYEEKEQE